MLKHANRYKFNTAVKALVAYQAFSALQTYRHVDQNTFMSHMARANAAIPIIGYSGAFAAICMTI